MRYMKSEIEYFKIEKVDINLINKCSKINRIQK